VPERKPAYALSHGGLVALVIRGRSASAPAADACQTHGSTLISVRHPSSSVSRAGASGTDMHPPSRMKAAWLWAALAAVCELVLGCGAQAGTDVDTASWQWEAYMDSPEYSLCPSETVVVEEDGAGSYEVTWEETQAGAAQLLPVSCRDAAHVGYRVRTCGQPVLDDGQRGPAEWEQVRVVQCAPSAVRRVKGETKGTGSTQLLALAVMLSLLGLAVSTASLPRSAQPPAAGSIYFCALTHALWLVWHPRWLSVSASSGSSQRARSTGRRAGAAGSSCRVPAAR
jgi:hypothetical protein